MGCTPLQRELANVKRCLVWVHRGKMLHQAGSLLERERWSGLVDRRRAVTVILTLVGLSTLPTIPSSQTN